jgi:hypothetical protein
MVDARHGIHRLSVFVQRILFGNFTILNPQNNAEMDYKKNRY